MATTYLMIIGQGQSFIARPFPPGDIRDGAYQLSGTYNL